MYYGFISFDNLNSLIVYSGDVDKDSSDEFTKTSTVGTPLTVAEFDMNKFRKELNEDLYEFLNDNLKRAFAVNLKRLDVRWRRLIMQLNKKMILKEANLVTDQIMPTQYLRFFHLIHSPLII